jgi:hypothetical protein
MDLPEKGDIPDDERHQRAYWAKESVYNDWIATITRPKTVMTRYRELIRLDAEYEITEATLTADATLDGATVAERIEADDIDAGAARVAAVSIQRHCRSAIQDARANGADQAAEKLAEIQKKAETLLETE